ncbi:hypothetical protein QJS04_geneDACA013581 [Acorus gramineus]|uniref:RBR-type E3 ubiquitin transferase n=1 Tax=Acorus gramineus TaxID=55184 RepID=A0AAV9AGJ9_ACOGR|nr:hypothetical protein QJS04_geneDACA013581 [Acorus gramineus]
MEECVDEFYLSALSDHDQLFPISDQTYAEELHLQEVLMSCILSSLPIQEAFPPLLKSPTREVGQSSGSHIFCGVCMDEKPSEDMFKNTNSPSCATHSFCHDCISRYIAAQLQENISMSSIRCPEIGCMGTLEPEFCRAFVPPEVFERWDKALCESALMGSERFYCPFKDCSALLLGDDVVGRVNVREAECPACNRLFCVQCKVKWHSGLKCEEFQGLRGDEKDLEDMKFVELAMRKQWRSCPRCRMYVERTEGCPHMKCSQSHFD